MKKSLSICTLILLMLTGCGPSQQSSPSSSLQITDSLNRTVDVPESPNRIISLASSNTEILFALGLDQEIIGTTEFCTYPEAAKSKPRLGGFAPQTFNVEAIAALKPDLVLTSGEFHRPVMESLEKLGIRVAGFQGESIAEIEKNIKAIGRLVHRSKEAESVTAAMKSRLETIQNRVRKLPRKDVFYLVSDDPLMTAGAKSMITEAIEIAGGRNLFADIPGDYVRISDEEVLRRNPAIILLPSLGHDGRTKPPAVLSSLEAVRTNRVYTIDADPISRPAPRIVDAIEQIARILHPEPEPK